MKIAIFGGSGKVGRLVVQKLLEEGHEVTMLVHSTAPFATHKNIKIVKGDVHELASVQQVIEGCEAVVCTLGSWGTPSKDIVSSATQAIVQVAQPGSRIRFVSVTGADARAIGDKLGLLHRLSHPLLSVFAGKVLRDSERHITMLENSSLKWTVIRSPVMTNSGQRAYKLVKKRPQPWAVVPRQVVADAIVEQLHSDMWSNQSPFIKSTT